jgi:hypothetical protein
MGYNDEEKAFMRLAIRREVQRQKDEHLLDEYELLRFSKLDKDINEASFSREAISDIYKVLVKLRKTYDSKIEDNKSSIQKLDLLLLKLMQQMQMLTEELTTKSR